MNRVPSINSNRSIPMFHTIVQYSFFASSNCNPSTEFASSPSSSVRLIRATGIAEVDKVVSIGAEVTDDAGHKSEVTHKITSSSATKVDYSYIYNLATKLFGENVVKNARSRHANANKKKKTKRRLTHVHIYCFTGCNELRTSPQKFEFSDTKTKV